MRIPAVSASCCGEFAETERHEVENVGCGSMLDKQLAIESGPFTHLDILDLEFDVGGPLQTARP